MILACPTLAVPCEAWARAARLCCLRFSLLALVLPAVVGYLRTDCGLRWVASVGGAVPPAVNSGHGYEIPWHCEGVPCAERPSA